MRAREALAGAVRGLPREFWWVWASILVNWAGGFATPLIALYLTTGRGYSAWFAGLVVALVGAGGVAGTLLGGVLTDRVGRRATLLGAHLWTAVSMALIGLADRPWSIMAATLAMGLGQCAARPAMQAILADLVPPQDRERAYALNYWALNVGFAVAAMLAGLLVTCGFTLVFVADGATTLLCALLVYLKLPETAPRPAAPRSAAAGAEPVATARRRTTVLRDGRFVLLVVSTLLFGSVMQQAQSTLPLAMVRSGLSASAFSTVIALNGLLIMLLQIPLTGLVRGRSRTGVLLVAGLLLAWGFGVNAVAHGIVVYALSVALWTLGEILQAPVGIAVVADRAPAGLRGRYQGLYSTAWSGASFLGPAGGAWVLDRFGPAALWWLCAGVGTVAALGSAAAVHGMGSHDTGDDGRARPGERRTVRKIRNTQVLPQAAEL
ncbi:MFS transporter [Kitasatospora sp. GP82]|uniref:MDR family MFS transporter n=1 Tax=Kitasatospora sp. GP82 TaxID=3035089 RepID=UPI0024769A09|nr:MFS transporter [Kitasatospora sp. GP82]MDH6125872.1 MFS family permease [Kitasatospora sp. GP82]